MRLVYTKTSLLQRLSINNYLLGGHQDKKNPRYLVGTVVPCMYGASLHYGIAWLDCCFDAVVHLQHDFARHDNAKIQADGSMHGRG